MAGLVVARPARARLLVTALTAALLLGLAESAWAEPAVQSTREVVMLLLGIFAIFIAILGSLAGYYYYTGHRAQRRAEASATWPTTQGKVIAAGVERRVHAKGGTTYEPRLRYEYTVAGARHECNVIQFGALAQATQAMAETMIAPYPLGAAAIVHYDPASPDSATLDTSAAAGRTRKKVAIAILAVGLAVYAIVAWVVFANLR
ncbi:MAG: hypothetical protein QOC56_878 [Alphaproteobacteria bacterium]|jgi:hypothetical protein|nr:hypothetical protein [Alphaproteobacteria bacterium]